jgi:TRAP-type C4-dicarboxylate transport system substrate-binding protein
MNRIAKTLLLLSLTAGCDADVPEGEVWRFAIEETRGSVQDAYAQRFAERIEAATDGEVDVIVYPYGTLGTSDHITEQLHNGTLELATASPGHLGKLIPELQVFLLHYALPDTAAEARSVLADPRVVAMLDALYREKGLRYLAAFSEGWQVWTTRKPIRSPEDFEGVKFRVMTSPLLVAAYQAYGASPTPLPYSEVYGALQLRMIDGQVNPIFAIQEMSFYEVTDYLVFAGQAQFFTTVAANPEWIESLPSERRELLFATIADLGTEIAEIEERYNRERLDIIRERRPEIQVIELTPEERARFREASLPVRDVYLDMAGPRGHELLELLLR